MLHPYKITYRYLCGLSWRCARGRWEPFSKLPLDIIFSSNLPYSRGSGGTIWQSWCWWKGRTPRCLPGYSWFRCSRCRRREFNFWTGFSLSIYSLRFYALITISTLLAPFPWLMPLAFLSWKFSYAFAAVHLSFKRQTEKSNFWLI